MLPRCGLLPELFYQTEFRFFFVKTKLRPIQRGERAMPAEQLGKGSLLDDLAVAQD